MSTEAYQYQAAKLKEIKKTLQGVLDGFHAHPEQIAELLAFKSQFYNYSMNNTALIHSQNPHVTYVASYKDWLEKGYHVRQGQHGLKVLFPIRTELIQVGEQNGKKQYRRVADATPEEKRLIESGQLKPVAFTRFGIGTVFDISQTDCPPEKYPSFFHMGYSSEQHAALYQAVKEYAEQKGLPVQETDLHSISLRGDFDLVSKTIRISDKLNDSEKLSTLTHELGHSITLTEDNFAKLPDAVKELEADSISIMLQQYVGIAPTESRTRHFVDCYNLCKGIKEFKIEDVLKDVNAAYYRLHQQLEPIFDRLVSRKTAEKSFVDNLINGDADIEDYKQYDLPEEELANYSSEEFNAYQEKLGMNDQEFRAWIYASSDDRSWLLRNICFCRVNDLNFAEYWQKQKLIGNLESYTMPDTLNKFQQAGLLRAVKRYFLTGEQDGQKHLEEFFSYWADKGVPVSQETKDIMVQTYNQIVKDLSASFPKPADVEKFYGQIEYMDEDGKTAERVLFTDKEKYEAQVKEDLSFGRPLIPTVLTEEEYQKALLQSDQGVIVEREPPAAEEEKPPEPGPQSKTLSPPPRDYKEHDNAVLEQIKYGISIVTLASDMGFTPKQIGGYYTLKEHDSVRFYPETNSFMQFSSGKGGSTIDFVMNFGGYNQQDAIRYLKEKYAGNVVDHPVSQPVKQPAKAPEKKKFKLPEPVEGKYSRAFAYLTKARCLDPEIVQQCFKGGLIYEDKKHNAVFVGKDADGNASYATRRSTLTKSNFKGDVAGSRQDIGFFVNSPTSEKLYVCEAPIDALSIMSLMKKQGKPLEHASYLATGGTGKDAALYTRLRENPHIREVVLANDRDAAGLKANKKMLERLSKDFPQVKVAKLDPKQGKDVNEYLQSRVHPPKTEARGMEVER